VDCARIGQHLLVIVQRKNGGSTITRGDFDARRFAIQIVD
jgi:hypothetical protein